MNPIAFVKASENQYQIFEAENLAHLIGRLDGNGWSANTTQDTEGWLIYGPYTKNVDIGNQKVTFKIMINNVGLSDKVARIDVFDATSNLVLAEKDIYGNQFAAAGVYQDWNLEFYNSTLNHMLEFRVYWYDKSNMTVDNIKIIKTDRVFEAETLAHIIGRLDNDGWSANVSQDNEGSLIYGPYTKDIDIGTYEVKFRMMIDSVNNSEKVAKIDVLDASTGKVLVEKDIYSNQFEKAYTYQNINIDFYNTAANHMLEFRVFWYDKVYMKVDNVKIVRERIYEAENLCHNIGRLDGDGWFSNVNTDNEGHLIFGPYTRDIDAGEKEVTYRIKIDSINGSDKVALVDVFDATTGCILSQKDIYRYQFYAANTYQDFSIEFYNPAANHQLEFRLLWLDKVNMKVDCIITRQQNINKFEYQYDTNNRIVRIVQNGKIVQNYEYDSNGNIKRIIITD